MFEMLGDWRFWLVTLSIVIGFFITVFLFPQKAQDTSIWEAYEKSPTRIVVYVKASTYEQALKELEREYLQKGWYVSAFDYDKDKQLFIFVLRKEGTK